MNNNKKEAQAQAQKIQAMIQSMQASLKNPAISESHKQSIANILISQYNLKAQ